MGVVIWYLSLAAALAVHRFPWLVGDSAGREAVDADLWSRHDEGQWARDLDGRSDGFERRSRRISGGGGGQAATTEINRTFGRTGNQRREMWFKLRPLASAQAVGTARPGFGGHGQQGHEYLRAAGVRGPIRFSLRLRKQGDDAGKKLGKGA